MPDLKRAILSVLARDDLKACVDDLELEGVDRRSAEAMRAALSRSRKATPEFLLGDLYKETLQDLCDLMGLPRSGSREDLVERLLESNTGGRGEVPAAAAPQESDREADRSRAGGDPAGSGRRAARSPKARASDANLGFEAILWAAADKLRGAMDAAEYKHVVLGLIFLKYISDAFEEKHAELLSEAANPTSDWYVAEPSARYQVAEDRDEYQADNIFWVPREARWSSLKANAKQPTIGKLVDDAMVAVERENGALKGVLPKDYGRPNLDKRRLGELIDLISTIGLGDAENRSKDILGRVYEYFLGRFASTEGKKGGEFYTPRGVVRVLVEMLAPRENSRIYDPCCGSGGMFVQSEEFVEMHGGRRGAVAVYGQELNHTTWRLCQMNLAIRGIEAHIAYGDTFHNDLHKDLKADVVIANPPFNMSDWGGDQLRDDVRWKYGAPPVGNANYAWIQHFVHHLAPHGTAGFVMANGSMSTNQSGEGDIRRAMVEADLVDCVVALPGQLFYSTQIPVCLWLVTRSKRGGGRGLDGRPLRDRSGETLFIDARKLGSLVDRIHRELSSENIARIAGTYHVWRGDSAGDYADVSGFCRAATLEEVQKQVYVLTPGRYVGAEEAEDDGEPFEERVRRLTATLREQQAEAATLDAAIAANLKELGYGR